MSRQLWIKKTVRTPDQFQLLGFIQVRLLDATPLIPPSLHFQVLVLRRRSGAAAGSAAPARRHTAAAAAAAASRFQMVPFGTEVKQPEPEGGRPNVQKEREILAPFVLRLQIFKHHHRASNTSNSISKLTAFL